MKTTVKKVGKDTEEYIAREVRANNVRRQSLDDLNYINFNENSIIFVNPAPNERIDELQNTLRSLYGKKIANLTGISNTDLKFMYGPANLPALTEYDQNYTTLTRHLYELAIELDNLGLRDEAVSALTYGVSVNTDISGNYITLANIYIETNQYAKIEQLIASAENIKSMTKASTIRKLQKILDTHTAERVSNPMMLPDIPLDSNESDTVSEPVSMTSDDSMLPKDILDILDFVNDTVSDQKP